MSSNAGEQAPEGLGKRVRKPPNRLGNPLTGNAVNKGIKGAEKAVRQAQLSGKAQKALERRKEREEKLGLKANTETHKNDKGPPIPWLPFRCNPDGSFKLMETLSSDGHGEDATFTAKWIAPDYRVPGVYMYKETPGVTAKEIRHAVYTAATHLINFSAPAKKKLYLTNGALQLKLEGGTPHVNTKLIHKKMKGPSVSGINGLIHEIIAVPDNTQSALDLLSFKLLGDRMTADTAAIANQEGIYLVKPIDMDFVQKLESFTFAMDEGRELEIPTLEKAVVDSFESGKSGFFFKKSYVYTGDRPLFVYCVLMNIPVIMEKKVDEVVSFIVIESDRLNLGRNLFKKYFDDLKKKKRTPPQKYIWNIVFNMDMKALSIFDCFHDFFGKRAPMFLANPERLANILKSGYDEKYHEMIDYMIDNTGTTGQMEKIITAVLDNATTINSERLLELFKTQPEACIVYDAGMAIPGELRPRVAVGTQRFTDGYNGGFVGSSTFKNYRRNPNFMFGKEYGDE